MGTTPGPKPVSEYPVQVGPKHYTVEFENERVRVLRITHGPREKSVMHGHPAIVSVALTDAHLRFSYPDGRTEEIETEGRADHVVQRCFRAPSRESERQTL